MRDAGQKEDAMLAPAATDARLGRYFGITAIFSH